MTARHFHRPPTRQQGVALVIVLILLLVMTLLGLASLRGTLLEERMSANLYDRSLSFQAAEAALREAEERADGITNPAGDFPANGCDAGLCAAPDADDPDRWTLAASWTDAASAAAATDLQGLTDAPRYIIEWLQCPGTNPVCRGDGAWPDNALECTTSGDVSPDAQCANFSFRYRITVRSQVADRAAVVLQSNFVAP